MEKFVDTKDKMLLMAIKGGSFLDKRHVLVVDDNAANLFVLSTMLKQMGFAVDEATSGMEAIDLSCKKMYDVIFMDHLMPEMDGIEAIKQLLFIANGEKRPVIIGVSATVDAQIEELFKSAGADEILEKPVTKKCMEELLCRLRIETVQEDTQKVVPEFCDIECLLEKIHGLDFRKGISLMAGNVDNYMKVLNVCIRNIKDNYSALDVLQKTNQVDSFALGFHSLKGVFLNIGADELATRSKSLELAAKDKRTDFVLQEVGAYLEDVNTFLQELEEICEEYAKSTKSNKNMQEVSNTEFERKIQQLKEHIENFEYIEITETLELLLDMVQGEEKETLEKVYSAIQDFDYEEAMNTLDGIKFS